MFTRNPIANIDIIYLFGLILLLGHLMQCINKRTINQKIFKATMKDNIDQILKLS